MMYRLISKELITVDKPSDNTSCNDSGVSSAFDDAS